MKIAIMQPYLFPYIGYFQLIAEVDTFVFYDDVNYITRGWINRNKVLINGNAKYFTVPCKDASQNKLINEVELALTDKKKKKLLRSIKFSYANAPYFEEVFKLVEDVLNYEAASIAGLAAQSIKQCCDYLNIKTEFKISSVAYDNSELDRADRLIDICKAEGVTNYVNAAGGKELYDKKYFKDKGVILEFIEPDIVKYEQFDNDFIPGLSIIDIMMFNSIEEIQDKFLSTYTLV